MLHMKLAPWAYSLLVVGTIALDHHWPFKNGNHLRTGLSLNTVSTKLTQPSWTFEEPYPKSEWYVIYGSPLIDAQRNIYLSGTGGRLYALDENGRLRWNHSESELWLGDCALQGAFIYCAGRSGYAFALHTASGKEHWRVRVAKNESIPTDGFSVVVAGDTLILPANRGSEYLTNDLLIALDINDGRVKWEIGQMNRGFNLMPAVVNETVVFGDTYGGVHRVSLKDGSYLWYMPGPHPGNAVENTGGGTVGQNGLAYVVSHAYGRRRVFEKERVLQSVVTMFLLLSTSAAFCLKPRRKKFKKCGRIMFIFTIFFPAAEVAWAVVSLGPKIPHWQDYGVLQAVHISNGTEAWSRSMVGAEVAAAPSVGYLADGSSLVVFSGHKVCTGDVCTVYVQAYDASNGATRWVFAVPNVGRGLPFDVSATKTDANDPTLTCIPDRFTNSAVGADGTLYINIWNKAWAIKDVNGDGFIDPNDEAEASSYDFGTMGGLSRSMAVQENAVQGGPALAPGMLVISACFKTVAFKE